MIIIAFCKHTTKKIPNLLCRGYKHAAPIAAYPDKLIMYQFVRHGVTEKIELHMRDLQILQKHGWHFVYLTGDISHDFCINTAYTCVQLSKQAIGIKNWQIQTPQRLYKFLQHN